jgi:hypothetical protein
MLGISPMSMISGKDQTHKLAEKINRADIRVGKWNPGVAWN